MRVSGATRAGAKAAVAGLLDQGADGLLSFGIAGGLAPQLISGTLVIAECIIGPAGARAATDAAWRARLIALAGDCRPIMLADILGCDEPLTGTSDKRAAHRETGAAVVDMESHIVAAAAAAADIPLLAIRAVADPAARTVPAWAPGALDATGRPRLGRVALGLARRPSDIGNLVALVRDNRAALAALRRVAALGAPLFGVV